MIDVEPEQTESFEDKLFEKADHIGDTVTGQKKYSPEEWLQIQYYIQRLKSKKSTSEKPKKISPITLFINKYKNMSLSRLIGLSIIIIFALIAISTLLYLLFTIMMKLMTSGILGIIGFGVLMFGISISSLLVYTLRLRRK